MCLYPDLGGLGAVHVNHVSGPVDIWDDRTIEAKTKQLIDLVLRKVHTCYCKSTKTAPWSKLYRLVKSAHEKFHCKRLEHPDAKVCVQNICQFWFLVVPFRDKILISFCRTKWSCWPLMWKTQNPSTGSNTWKANVPSFAAYPTYTGNLATAGGNFCRSWQTWISKKPKNGIS